MPQGSASQTSDDLSDIGAWIARRNARLALQPEADAFARNLWNQKTQNGGDLYAGNPSDLTAIGLAALSGARSYQPTSPSDEYPSGDYGAPYPSSTAAGPSSAPDSIMAVGGADQGRPYPAGGSGFGFQRSSPPPQSQYPGPSAASPDDASIPSVSELDVIGRPPTPPPYTGFLDSLNHNPIARGLAGIAGYAVGLPSGVGRGAWHAAEGLGHGLNFAGSLFFPEGRAAAWNEATAATHNALQYGRSVAANPSRLAADVSSVAKAANRSLNPLATPIPDTATGAFGHELGIGMNDSETLANIVGLVATPELVGGVNAARSFAATREANIAEMIERGLDEPTARDLSKGYQGKGDHAVIQNSQKSILGFKTPWLKKAPIPKGIIDGPFNVSRPRGLSQYDFYKYHYGVDPKFHGGRLPNDADGPRGFSGRGLGFERYDQPGRTWARIPQIWKDYDAGVASGSALGLLPQDAPETPQ